MTEKLIATGAMMAYIGTKMVNAMPMTRGDYNEYRGWKVPENETGADEGYLVEYVNSSNSNTPDFAGYVSWSPKCAFEEHYRNTDELTFGLAVEAAKKGYLIRSADWNGKHMYVKYVPKSILADGSVLNHHWLIRTPNGSFSTWTPSSNDSLAENWQAFIATDDL
jgi:hypothetical protein